MYKFIPVKPNGWQRVQKQYQRMMFGTNHIVRWKWEGNGWSLKETKLPLTAHTKQWLRQRGWPVLGPNKCKLTVCQPEYRTKFGR